MSTSHLNLVIAANDTKHDHATSSTQIFISQRFNVQVTDKVKRNGSLVGLDAVRSRDDPRLRQDGAATDVVPLAAAQFAAVMIHVSDRMEPPQMWYHWPPLSARP